MKLDIDFSELESLTKKMGATPIKWRSDATLKPLEPLKSGTVYDLNEIGEKLTPDGNLLINPEGDHILLYIPEREKKFHLTDCKTIRSMKEGGRFDRYIWTQETSGLFEIEDTDIYGKATKDLIRLKVCKNCLRRFNYKGSATSMGRRELVCNSFNIEEFFKEYETYFTEKPRYTKHDYPGNSYAGDWKESSKNYRESVGWKCEKCDVDLSDPKYHSLLHTHHINGVKSDNRRSNLKALCILCHGDQHNHRHILMNIKSAYKQTIKMLRREQRKRKLGQMSLEL